jgi:hypothetical protein
MLGSGAVQLMRAKPVQIAWCRLDVSQLSQKTMPTEADTCRKFVVPKLLAAGWDNEPHSIAEQRTITGGRVVPVGKGFIRKPPKRVDYLLRYTRDFPLAVVELQDSRRCRAAGTKLRRDARLEIRVRDQRARHHRN